MVILKLYTVGGNLATLYNGATTLCQNSNESLAKSSDELSNNELEQNEVDGSKS